MVEEVTGATLLASGLGIVMFGFNALTSGDQVTGAVGIAGGVAVMTIGVVLIVNKAQKLVLNQLKSKKKKGKK